jgi:hypothetical protein
MVKIPLEKDEQKQFIKYLRKKRLIYASISNENILSYLNRTVAARVMKELKEMGLQPAFPDLMVMLPTKMVFVEMKRIKRSRTSDEQKIWNIVLDALPYASAYICKGSSKAIEVIEKELKNVA